MSTDKPGSGSGDDPYRPSSHDRPLSREEFYGRHPLRPWNDPSGFPARRPPPDAFPRNWSDHAPDREADDSSDRETDHAPDREVEPRELLREAMLMLSDKSREVGRLESRNDYLQDKLSQAQSELSRAYTKIERLESREVEPVKGLESRELPEKAEILDDGQRHRKWLRWPTGDEVKVAGTVGAAADAIAVATHTVSDTNVAVGSAVTVAAVSVVMHVRKRWEERNKNAD